MLYTGVKGYFNKLIIYFKSWRILILILITLYLIVVDQSENYFINYNIAYVLWILYYSQSTSKKPKEWRMLCLLPADSKLRALQMVSEAIGMTMLLIVWRIGIYGIELLLNLYTLQKAVHRFLGIDLILILLIAIISRISVNKAKIVKVKNKKLENTVIISSTILICIHMVLFILKLGQGWLGISFMFLAYFAIAAIWYVLLLNLRNCEFDYEAVMTKPLKQ